jgi:hypothetical protein
MTIAERVAICLDGFKGLSAAAAQVTGSRATKYSSVLPLVPDQFGRFKVWSGNIGAHRSGRGSLDYRLRDASHLQNHFLDLLNDLSEALSNGRSFMGATDKARGFFSWR